MGKRIVFAGFTMLLFGLCMYGSAHIMDVQRERGDVNGDGAINVLDAVQAIHIVLGTSPPPSGEELWAADCNGDGEANVLDVLGIVNVILGIGTCVSSCDELDCDDGNPCTEDYCDSLLVQCRHDPLENGTSCDDGDPHTENDVCVDGICGGSPLNLAEELQEALDNALERHQGMGASAAVIITGHEPWLGVSGVSHDSVHITPDMLFNIGSVTKSFTAALVLKLAEEGLLTLEDSLHQWLPSFPNIDSTITVQQLLNHTSGVNCFYNNDEMWDAIESGIVRDWTPEDIISYVPEPYFPPGTDWHYSNANYTLLGMIIKEATGSSVSTELRNRLWEPLGLNNTFLASEETLSGSVAHFWSRDNFGHMSDLTDSPRRINEERVAWTSGGVYSTAEDIATWSQILYGGEVLNQASMEQMLTFVPTPAAFGAAGYGCGVVSYYPEWANGEESIGHTGGFIAHMTYMVYLPDHDVSITVMVNDWNSDCIEAIKDDLIQVALDHLLRQELQETMDTVSESEGILGAAAAVQMPGHELWVGTVGTSFDTTPVERDMIFSIASITKSFVATVILRLAEDGVLILDDALYQWLPAYPNIDGTVTIRQLLNHTSGIHSFSWDADMFFLDNPEKVWTPEEIITTLVDEPYFAPGTSFHYSNTNYILLGMIIEEATGSNVSTQIRHYISNPLGLSHTFLGIEEQIAGEIAHGWDDIDGDSQQEDLSLYPRDAFNSLLWTCGGMYSSAEDLVTFSRALFQGDLLTQASLDQMLDFYPYPPDPTLGCGLGMCIIANFIPGVRGIGHTGGIYGYVSSMVYMPDYEAYISVTVNASLYSNSPHELIANALAEKVIDHLAD